MDNEEVDELTKVLSDDYCDTFSDEQGQWCSLNCGKCRAERVIEAGYHKAADESPVIIVEVQQIKVKEILQELYDMCFELEDPDSGSDKVRDHITPEYLVWYAKEMGVVIDE